MFAPSGATVALAEWKEPAARPGVAPQGLGAWRMRETVRSTPTRFDASCAELSVPNGGRAGKRNA